MFPINITLTIADEAALQRAISSLAFIQQAVESKPVVKAAEVKEYRDANGVTMAEAKQAVTAGKSAKGGDAPGQTTVTKGDAPEKTAAASTPAAGNAAAESQASTAATELTYDVVGKAITEKAKTDRAHAIATLEAFGVKKGPELKPEQYADFLKALG